MGIRIRPAEVEVPRDTPFQYDLLDRKEPAKFLTQLVDGIDGPCVMAIDAPWGGGQNHVSQDVVPLSTKRGISGRRV